MAVDLGSTRNAEVDQANCQLSGLQEQIEKQHWLNVHFRAFQLADYAWKQHIMANARLGSEHSGSPCGAVLDGKREE